MRSRERATRGPAYAISLAQSNTSTDEYSRVTAGQLYRPKVKANSETGKVKLQHPDELRASEQARETENASASGATCGRLKFTLLLSSSRVHTKLHIARPPLPYAAFLVRSRHPRSRCSFCYFIAARGHLARSIRRGDGKRRVTPTIKGNLIYISRPCRARGRSEGKGGFHGTEEIRLSSEHSETARCTHTHTHIYTYELV